MGNADSKVAAEGGEDPVIPTISSKGSQFTEFTDFEEEESPTQSRQPRKKSNDKQGNRKKGQRNEEDEKKGRNIETVQSRDDEDNNARTVGMIQDEKINVNLAMADLMAYLQVVANNSNNLPLTRRDDPELDRTVSTLTSEGYARKSAAFVPADVRVLGGTFTRYGRVWDLPTSEEYNACDGAHEPGRSYGGACVNSLLKVVYDAVNTVEGTAQSTTVTDSLFDDDDEEEESILAKSLKSNFSLEATNPNPSTITWADMIRQMKAEFKDIGYAQVPKITSTRKIDLNKPFSLVGDSFDKVNGTKRSLLIGCNYNKIRGAELKASHDDVRSMKDYIVNVHGFPESEDLMTVLLDDNEHNPPSFMNIIDAFKKLSEESQPGDAVFVQFSGHGGRVLDANVHSEAESYDEVIVPVDYAKSGLIRDTLIFKTLLAPMRYGVTVTIMIDCCDNGMVLELPYGWGVKSDKREAVAKLTMNDDFSFVRFLKVVKTLYESSTFTQLGRTVGSALSPTSLPEKAKTEPSKPEKDGNDETDGSLMVDAINKSGDSILDALTEACSPSRKELAKAEEAEKEGAPKNQLMALRESLFDKVMNCTLLAAGDEESDDEQTFKTRTEDEQSYGDVGGSTSLGDSFDTASDAAELEAEKRKKRRS